MSNLEKEPNQSNSRSEAFSSIALSPELTEYLIGRKYACVLHSTDQGTALIIKAPRHNIESVRPSSILVRHELFRHSEVPVISITVRIYSESGQSRALHTTVNVAQAEQRARYAGLANQQEIPLYLLDDALELRLTSRVCCPQEAISWLLRMADELVRRNSIMSQSLDYSMSDEEKRTISTLSTGTGSSNLASYVFTQLERLRSWAGDRI